MPANQRPRFARNIPPNGNMGLQFLLGCNNSFIYNKLFYHVKKKKVSEFLRHVFHCTSTNAVIAYTGYSFLLR